LHTSAETAVVLPDFFEKKIKINGEISFKSIKYLNINLLNCYHIINKNKVKATENSQMGAQGF